MVVATVGVILRLPLSICLQRSSCSQLYCCCTGRQVGWRGVGGGAAPNPTCMLVRLQWVPFYKERSMMHTTLGSLLVVLLLRTAHYNLAKLRDVYLHTNTLAALANLAPHMSGGGTPA